MKCPFRIDSDKTDFTHAHTSHVREHFADCLGKECAAYCQGGCLRLVPPALLLGDSPLRMRADITDAEIKKMREEISKAPIMPAPVEPPEPWPSCSTCANQESKAGCADCIFNADNRRRKETLQFNWAAKEVP